jgi:hypothetical protein
MNTTQAVVLLKNGMKKYGSILNSDLTHTVMFIPGIDSNFIDTEYASNLIQYISIDEIESIDTYLK